LHPYLRGSSNQAALKHNAQRALTVHPSELDQASEDLPGILPIAKSAKWDGWALPGHGSAYSDCGRFVGWKGCLNLRAHDVQTIDGKNYRGKIYAKGFRRVCGRSECPLCFEKWASKQAHLASKRLLAYRAQFRRPIHIVISPPSRVLEDLEYRSLRKHALARMKDAGIEGALLIVHPYRKAEGKWVVSPHFHAIGYGWVKNTAQIFERSGWFIKNLGIRGSSRATILYQLSHAGVKKSIHTLTWVGALSYNKLKFKFVQEKETCPICQGDLTRISWTYYDRPPPIPEKEDEFIINADGWTEKTYNYYD